MTLEPVGYVTCVNGAVGREEVTGDLGDDVALLCTGRLSARGDRQTDAGPIRSVTVHTDEILALPLELAEELIVSVRRHSRQRTMAEKGNDPLVDGDGNQFADPGPTPEEIVRDWVQADGAGPFDDEDGDLELDDDVAVADVELGAEGTAALGGDQADVEIEYALDEDGFAEPVTEPEATLEDLRRVTAEIADLQALEAAWAHVDKVTPGYADLDEPARMERFSKEQHSFIAPWSLRHYLLIEQTELGGSQFLIKAIQRRIDEGIAHYTNTEPWKGYSAKATGTVDKILAELDKRRETDVERGNREGVLEHVDVWERAHKARVTILQAIAEERTPIVEDDDGPPAPDPDFEPTEDLDADEG